ncbi:hypothetical protein BFW01_g6471 [Lasiodiplodia theobromae]|uniref:Uncharacterized protein n=2 Tax=Lasiodiplodia TaxID=66739 RepID=A0A5N5DAA3_9PEZI|nr:uncharacterized protein LTHEOB_11227 [Lasiodiplodia theobromae]KAB2574547.1 hypothetical protein DBV05_g6774 [Lasiodiplodia theobromae]KAF4537907.1 hypothetical protein LTHEOB_11227 [Lasiodiplodia theobromae]KAF9635576.1 hypothetical protein BFW01_g6471 [Lasiodiplodia theobromae]KAK0665085.1 hypothetical protein DIS24_g111 [Lasiodiplodia hormozganensis]
MRFSIATAAFALSSLFMGAVAAPTNSDLITRTDVQADVDVTVLSVLTDLKAQVEVHTGNINSTCGGLGLGLDVEVDLSTPAIVSIKAEITAIIDVITTATAKIQGCEAGADVSVIVDLALKIVLEILFTLNASVKIVGVVSLSLLNLSINLVINVIANLLVAIEAVVGGVLESVWVSVHVCLDLVLPGLVKVFVGLGVTLNGECGCLSL